MAIELNTNNEDELTRFDGLKFRVKGDSMSPRIMPGDILVVEKNIINFKQITVVGYGGKIMARRVEDLGNGEYILVPENPDYPSIRTSAVHFFGSVVAVIRSG